jgi:uncharacterized protein (TIGR04255 family)
MLDLSKIGRPTNLPQWDAPPLDEVAIAIQFNNIAGLKTVHYGLLAERVRKFGLTHYEDKAPINASFEAFGKRVAPVQYQLQAGVPLPRVWYISDDNHRLIQFQSDKFICNWRKVEGVGEYPRFDKVVLPEFLERYQAFEAFLSEERLPAIALNQCELSYFNVIDIIEGETFSDALARVFRFWRAQGSTGTLNDGARLDRDGGSINLTHLLKAADGTPLARIHVNIVAAERRNQPIIRFALIFRGPWATAVDMPLMEFFARGREAIVRLFDAMISVEMHLAWGRTPPISGDL